MNIALAGPADTSALGQRLAGVLAADDDGLVVTLAGELGAGKTALVRATLEALGAAGPVVSPSYTLVETYPLGERVAHHLDLYRLGDPEELEFLGIRDIDAVSDLVFVEWAERGRGFLPPVDLAIEMAYDGSARQATLVARTPRGHRLLHALGAPSAL